MHIHSIQDLYYILTAISSTVILILSFLMAKIHLPETKGYQKLQRARFYLALSYFILGLAGFMTFSLPQGGIPTAVLLLVTSSVAAFQSLLFTAVHVVFIEPDAVNKEVVMKHIAIIGLTIVALFAIYFNDIIEDVILETIILTLYLALQMLYVSRFTKLYNKNVRHSNMIFSKKRSAKLRTLNYSFYGAFTIGLMALTAPLLGLEFYNVFIILFTLYYTYMVVILYNDLSPVRTLSSTDMSIEESYRLQNENDIQADAENKDEETEDDIIPVPENDTDEEVFKANLDKWVVEKGYLMGDLSVDEVAEILGTDRYFLRNYFRNHIHSDFRTWRSELRIKEAKTLLLEHPEYSTSQIGEMVGFNHRSNFFSQFTKITGISPKVWREKNLKE